jgi:hypothetical protein
MNPFDEIPTGNQTEKAPNWVLIKEAILGVLNATDDEPLFRDGALECLEELQRRFPIPAEEQEGIEV